MASKQIINKELHQYLHKLRKHIQVIDANEDGTGILICHVQNGQPFSKIPWETRKPHQCHQPFWINKKMLLKHLKTISREPIFKKIANNPVLFSATICPQCWNEYDKYLKALKKFEDNTGIID